MASRRRRRRPAVTVQQLAAELVALAREFGLEDRTDFTAEQQRAASRFEELLERVADDLKEVLRSHR